MNLKSVALEGGLLKELRIFGNGKNCCVRLETTEPEGTVHFDLMDPVVEIDLQGKVRSTVFNDRSDVELGFKVLPMEPLRVERFVVDYAGTDSKWKKDLEDTREGRRGPWGVPAQSIQLKLVPAQRYDSGAVRES